MSPAEHSDRDKQLWCAVIFQALEDAAGTVIGYEGGKNKTLVREEARNWFKDAGKDFREVCGLAGMDHEAVREAALRRFEQADAGEAIGQRHERRVTYNGKLYTVRQLSKLTGVSVDTLRRRIKSGVRGDALTAPRLAQSLSFNGETRTVADWSKITGIHPETIKSRLADGLSIEEALTPGRRKCKPRQAQRLDFRSPFKGRKGELYEHNGERLTLAEWSIRTGIPTNTLYIRIKRNRWPIDRALRTPVQERRAKTPERLAA